MLLLLFISQYVKKTQVNKFNKEGIHLHKGQKNNKNKVSLDILSTLILYLNYILENFSYNSFLNQNNWISVYKLRENIYHIYLK